MALTVWKRCVIAAWVCALDTATTDRTTVVVAISAKIA